MYPSQMTFDQLRDAVHRFVQAGNTDFDSRFNYQKLANELNTRSGRQVVDPNLDVERFRRAREAERPRTCNSLGVVSGIDARDPGTAPAEAKGEGWFRKTLKPLLPRRYSEEAK